MKIIDSIFKEKKENRLDFRHQYQTIFKFVDDGVAVLDKEDIPTISELQQKKAHLRVIDLTDAARSMRFNPIQHRYLPTMNHCQALAASLMATAIPKSINRDGRDYFHETAAVNFLTACIYFFVNYKRLPYDADGNELLPEYITDTETGHKKLSGRVFDVNGKQVVEPAYWLGKYSDMPHVLAFLNHGYKEIFEILTTDPEVCPLLAPFLEAYMDKDMYLLNLTTGKLRVQVLRLATKNLFWLMHRDGDDFIPAKDDCLVVAADNMPETVFSMCRTLLTLATEPITHGMEDVSGHPTVKFAERQKFYEFKSDDERERILSSNYAKVFSDIDDMILEIQEEYKGY